MNIMNINDSPNTTVVIGDRNKVNAQYKVNENKKSFIVPKWLRVSCWVIFAITICWLVLSVWYHYTTTDKILDAVIVGRVIQRYREKRTLSQEVVNELSDIGRTHLSAIKRGVRKPTLDTFFKLT